MWTSLYVFMKYWFLRNRLIVIKLAFHLIQKVLESSRNILLTPSSMNCKIHQYPDLVHNAVPQQTVLSGRPDLLYND